VTGLTLPGLPQIVWQVRSRSDPAARALGRVAISIDLSFDYCRAARWRVFDAAQAAQALARTWADRQGGPFDHGGGGR
jgi:hypothetical protein